MALEFDNIETIKRAVEVPSGVAILPAPTLAGEVKAGTLRGVRFRDRRPTRPLAIIHRRAEQLGLAASRFLELLTLADGPPASKPRDGPAFAADAPNRGVGRGPLKPTPGRVSTRGRPATAPRTSRRACRDRSPRRAPWKGEPP